MRSHFISMARAGLFATLAASCLAASSQADDSQLRRDSQNERTQLEQRFTPISSIERETLMAIQQEGRELVRELARQIRETQDPALRDALRARAAEIKTETRLRFLRAKVDFARERGDLQTEREALALIEAIENPPKPVPSFQIRRAPGERSRS